MLRLKRLKILDSKEALDSIPQGKVLINTINAHSYNVAQHDDLFAESLNPEENSENRCLRYLIPDGASIVKACCWLHAKSQPKERIAGWDHFRHEMKKLNAHQNQNENPVPVLRKRSDQGRADVDVDVDVPIHILPPAPLPPRKNTVMFMGSSESVLSLIRERAALDYPNLEVVTYSPPFKPHFSEADSNAIVDAINHANPDLLWIGMTAPKQEKWTYQHWDELHIHCHVGTIGAVFDFYAGTASRAPLWWQRHSLEWLYRLLKEPKRMWRRYVIGNPLFLWNVLKEYFFSENTHYMKKKM